MGTASCTLGCRSLTTTQCLCATLRYTLHPPPDTPHNAYRGLCFHSPAVLCLQLDSSGVSDGQKVQGFARVPELVASDHVSVDFHVDFDGRVPVKVELKTSDGSYPLKLSPGPGELVRPVVVSEADFDTKQSALTGLNQHVGSVDISAPALGGIAARVLAKCNVAAVVGPSSTKATPPSAPHLMSPRITHSLTHSLARSPTHAHSCNHQERKVLWCHPVWWPRCVHHGGGEGRRARVSVCQLWRHASGRQLVG